MTKGSTLKDVFEETFKTENRERMRTVKNYQIEMLNVENADAFIIFYEEDDGDKKLVLVDAGRYSNGEKVKKHLEKYYPGESVDLAIVTHCDEDHFGGFVYLLENGCKIENFWINVPKMHKDKLKFTNDDLDDTKSIDDMFNNLCSDEEDDVDWDNVYSVGGETKNLFKLIESKKIKCSEKFALEKEGSNFSFFHILGPTRDYYESLLSEFKFKSCQSAESETRKCFDEEKTLSPALDNADDDASSYNRSSIIFTFEPESGKKYLFMGDANREAFDNIPKSLKERYAKDVFWLKVPHHGSKHNLDSEMIEFIKPKVAYVSTENIDNHLSMATVNALSKIGCRLYSTHENRSDFLHHGKRSGYSHADPFNQKQLEKK